MRGSTKVEQASLPVPEWDVRITAVVLSRGDALGSYNPNGRSWPQRGTGRDACATLGPPGIKQCYPCPKTIPFQQAPIP
jgi:hypothetical protein